MNTLFMVRSVALYEAKLLVRSWAFRIFLLIVLFYSTLIFAASYFQSKFGTVSAMIPLEEFFYFSFFTAWVAAIIVPEMLASWRRTRITPVIHTRPVTNAEFLFGQMLGLAGVFMGLALVIDLIIGIVSAVFIEHISVNPLVFASYPLLMTLPMFIFLIGLTVFLDSLLRSREVVMLLLLVYVGAMIFSFDYGWNHLLDFRGVWAPLLSSDITGFGNTGAILLQRGIYFMLGIGFTFLAVAFYHRMPHSGRERLAGLVMFLVCTTGACMLGKIYLSEIAYGRELRTEINMLDDRLSGTPRVTVEACRIHLIHRAHTIEAVSRLNFTNRTKAPIEKYVFSLNPGLKVTGVTGGKGEMPFERRLHVLTITPPRPLAPGASDSLTIGYRGAVIEAACYPDIPESERDKDNIYSSSLIDRRYAFITPRYVLLTREALWYPVSGTPPGTKSSHGDEYDFTRYELTVKTGHGLTAISQGLAERTGEGSFGFRPETPLPKISLVIGRYEHKKIIVDGVEYGIYLIRGHDSFSRRFRELSSKKLAGVIRDAREETEGKIGLGYPFARLSLVETPVQFLSHQRFRSQSPETTQPEQILVPERGMFLVSNPMMYINSLERFNYMQRVPLTPVEMREKALGVFIRDNFTVNAKSGEELHLLNNTAPNSGIGHRSTSSSPYRYNFSIFPQFYTFQQGMTQDRSTPLSLALGYYLESGLTSQGIDQIKRVSTPGDEIVSRALAHNSLAEVLADQTKSDVARKVLSAKASMLITLLRAKSGVPEYKFDSFIRDYLKKNRFSTSSSESLAVALHSTFGVDVHSFLDQWANAKELPRYEFLNIRHTESPGPSGPLYHTRLILYNTEPVEGAVLLCFIVSEGEQLSEDAQRLVFIGGNEAREIHLIHSKPDPMLMIFPTLSQHIPNWFYIYTGPAVKSGPDTTSSGDWAVSIPHTLPDSTGVIVDNVDPGFSIVKKKNTKLVEKIRERFTKPSMEANVEFSGEQPPDHWHLAVNMDFYGRTERSAQWIKSGDGGESARWEADIPESGVYNIYYYNVYFWRESMNRYSRVHDFNFRIGHDDGASNVQMTSKGAVPPWTLLGSYRLSKGRAWVELSNKSKGKFVYADAVKWMKR
jgi:hypothetical protein